MSHSRIINQTIHAMHKPCTQIQLSTLFTIGLTAILEKTSASPTSRSILILHIATSYVAENFLRRYDLDWPLGLCWILSSWLMILLAMCRECYLFLASGPLPLQLICFTTSSIYAFMMYSKWAAGYQVFLSLGRGGTPYNALGYTIVSFKSLFGINPRTHPEVPQSLRPQGGFLDALPQREGERPIILGVAPQRQSNQRSDPWTTQRAISLLAEKQARLSQGRSIIEGRGSAVFPSDLKQARTSELIFGCEIGHVHEFDGSMHLNLHPADVSSVIRSGWGERHPLARNDWLWTAYFLDFWQFWGYVDARPPVPVGWTLVYAPRDSEERAIVLRIVQAAADWMTLQE